MHACLFYFGIWKMAAVLWQSICCLDVDRYYWGETINKRKRDQRKWFCEQSDTCRTVAFEGLMRSWKRKSLTINIQPGSARHNPSFILSWNGVPTSILFCSSLNQQADVAIVVLVHAEQRASCKLLLQLKETELKQCRHLTVIINSPHPSLTLNIQSTFN